MKSITSKIILIWGLVLFGCSPKPSALPNATAIVKPVEILAPTNRPESLQPTTAVFDTERANILSKIKQLADDYNTQVDQYQQKEHAQIIVDPNTSQEKLELSANAIHSLSPLYDSVSEQVGDLSEKYWELYQKDHPMDALPISMSKDELASYKQKLLNEFRTWETNELNHGTAIKLYNPDNQTFYRILIGDSFAIDRLKWNYITRIMALSNAPSQDLMNLDIQKIQKLDNGAVSLVSIDAYPPYRLDIKLTRYETNKASYLLDTDIHEFIEVVPKTAPQSNQVGSLESLKVQAIQEIKLLSSITEVNDLTLVQHQKAGAYFFRWEDRSKPFLDDGVTYPFIQIALNGKGELLNYCNTLPLVH